ncbi:hypothetical protein [Aeromonas jandaei]|uniref:hypothetical protein n=1 Tax=Aeromonas jandaei TaxID=650 RepID=UPI003B9DD028
MKKNGMVYFFLLFGGLAGCGGGDGDSSVVSSEKESRDTPASGVYIPILMSLETQFLVNDFSQGRHSVGMVYPESALGTLFTLGISEVNSTSAKNSTATFLSLGGFSSLDESKGNPLTLSIFAEKVKGFGNSPTSSQVIENSASSTELHWLEKKQIMDFDTQRKSMWVVDYRAIGYQANSISLFNNWGGQVALEPAAVTAVEFGTLWSKEGKSPSSTDFIGTLETQENGKGIRLLFDLPGASCTLTGVSDTNIAGLNKVTLNGWERCTFVSEQKSGQLNEARQLKKMADFSKSNDSVTAYLAMRPATDINKSSLVLGIPSVPGFIVELEPLQ